MGYLNKRFVKKLDISRVKKYCEKLEMVEGNIKNQADSIRVSCVQRSIRPVKRVEQFIDIIYGLVKEAVEDGAELIAFPEYNFFDLFGIIPGFKLINNYLSNHNDKSDDGKDSGNDSLIFNIFSSIAESVEKCMLEIFSALAKGYGVHIYTGSYIVKKCEALYNAGSVFAPDGKCIGTQKKIHLTSEEVQMGLSSCDTLDTFTINNIKVAFPICMDATYFETFKVARKLGVDVVVLPIANNEEYSLWRSLRGIWPRVQESYIYGVKPSLNGWIAGMHFTGKAGIFAPIELTLEKNGAIDIASHFEGDYVITQTLDMKKLYKARKEAQYYGDTNNDFEKGFESIYSR